MKDGQKLKLGDSHAIPRTYPRITSVNAWGCPRHSLLHQQKYQVIFQDTIFLLLHILCVILGASFVFYFSFVLFSLLQFMVGSQHIFLERFTLRFHCLEHSSFHSYYSVSVHFFCQYCVQLLFSNRIMFRDCWFASVIDDQLSSL